MKKDKGLWRSVKYLAKITFDHNFYEKIQNFLKILATRVELL